MIDRLAGCSTTVPRGTVHHALQGRVPQRRATGTVNAVRYIVKFGAHCSVLTLLVSQIIIDLFDFSTNTSMYFEKLK
jgi:hypothetical protein